jgi:hypothetical protein
MADGAFVVAVLVVLAQHVHHVHGALGHAQVVPQVGTSFDQTHRALAQLLFAFVKQQQIGGDLGIGDRHNRMVAERYTVNASAH